MIRPASADRRPPEIGVVAGWPVVGVEFPISLEVQISLITPERKDIADLRADADDAGFERADMVAAGCS
jgi:hypothetical protein